MFVFGECGEFRFFEEKKNEFKDSITNKKDGTNDDSNCETLYCI